MRAPRLRLGLLVLLVAGGSLWLAVVGGPSGGDLEQAVHRTGWLAPVVFVSIYAAWTVLLLPGFVPTFVGGALFGVLEGSALSVVGAVAGATLAFLTARRLGHVPVKELAGARADRLDEWLRRHGLIALLYARLVPIIPFNVLNYAAGLAGISTRRYVIATAVGILPGTVAYTVLGSSAAHPGSAPFIVSLAAVGLLTVAVATFSHLRRRALATR